jgi:hydrogenase maturation factor
MCQAPVGKVVKVGENSITVEYKGKRRKLRSRLPDVKEGEYVTFSLDIAIDRIDEDEALIIIGGMK